MEFARECGILLHPTSLPSKYGIGDLGEEAYSFVDFLKRSGQKLWQILPINPGGYGASPYQSPSAFAGNPVLISIDKLVSEGLLTPQDVQNIPSFDEQRVQYSRVISFKNQLLKKAFITFENQEKKLDYIHFLKENSYWLENYALYMALKYKFNGAPWNRWDKAAAFRDKRAVGYYKEALQQEIEYQYFLQYKFFTQWLNLKNYANQNGIKIIGDLPIYVSYDSSDTWANPNLFQLDSLGNPEKVAGVPPDYFSETGQLWGNPIYNWEAMKSDDYKWWRERINNLLKLVDIIRIDHFRGFEAYWEVPAGEKTAVNGRWVKGPGHEFFSTVKKYMQGNELPVIAEDLGVITPEVEELKDQFNFPGMKVLQFAFESGDQKEFAPEYHDKNSVVYTGTHDNDTILGWYKTIAVEKPETLKIIKKYYHLHAEAANSEDICWRFIETAYQSNANTAIIPLQDILCLGSEARMNTPGTAEGNWQWRYAKKMLTKKLEKKLAALASVYNR
ncbi:4-alpha-glucanotransferase [Desulfohalotomaculum tongense]|uniref:4-alpha-glucanotransferase n=1 Tax=Desulforadius tongensis TaxID=1216062 RepID=UPI0019566B13|nr:4-alpha-glucanotransferase [Desulforadius tongensis]MBM7854149.1 4-alpha-glucanotransferase [Desulforadius tongensis]